VDGNAWTQFTERTIVGSALHILDGAEDAVSFCPRYQQLNDEQRLRFWSTLVSGIVKFESNFEPTRRYRETTMGTDPVTNLPVYSEGLLQLSYQDQQWMRACRFDWNKDSRLSPTDPRKTILDPYINLECGLHILGRQIANRKRIVLSRGAYWAVIKSGSRYNKISQIQAITQRLSFCK
jgi:hypothetical protein